MDSQTVRRGAAESEFRLFRILILGFSKSLEVALMMPRTVWPFFVTFPHYYVILLDCVMLGSCLVRGGISSGFI